MSLRRASHMLWAYTQCRHLHLPDRTALQAHQARALRRFTAQLCRHSPYFAPYAQQPLALWPTMNKALMLRHFDSMNTAGLRLDDAMRVAMIAETQRDFSPTVQGITVGLSSGTSGQRGVFAVSEAEQARWAGVMLARALPDGLFSRERVALCLRANSRLYNAVRTPWIRFEFFDLFKPLDDVVEALRRYRPTVLVAPAQVLRALALIAGEDPTGLMPERVISAAEVLTPGDRALISQQFGPVHELYQATEGFLAATCKRGVLHLNEEYLLIEPEWLPVPKPSHAATALQTSPARFVPLITDFSRFTQPIVRYRLDDVLVAGPPCDCGRVGRTIAHIEGRCNDQFELPDRSGMPHPVFSDVLLRALAQVLPADADYQLDQIGTEHWRLQAGIGEDRLRVAREHLEQVLTAQGLCTSGLRWQLDNRVPVRDLSAKRRTLRRLDAGPPCASVLSAAGSA
jgi:putative adenylate-forming enzyme